MACAVGSSVALPSSIIPQVIEEGLVPDFDTGSWIGQLLSCFSSFLTPLIQLQVIYMLPSLQAYWEEF